MAKEFDWVSNFTTSLRRVSCQSNDKSSRAGREFARISKAKEFQREELSNRRGREKQELIRLRTREEIEKKEKKNARRRVKRNTALRGTID